MHYFWRTNFIRQLAFLRSLLSLTNGFLYWLGSAKCNVKLQLLRNKERNTNLQYFSEVVHAHQEEDAKPRTQNSAPYCRPTANYWVCYMWYFFLYADYNSELIFKYFSHQKNSKLTPFTHGNLSVSLYAFVRQNCNWVFNGAMRKSRTLGTAQSYHSSEFLFQGELQLGIQQANEKSMYSRQLNLIIRMDVFPFFSGGKLTRHISG